MLRTREVQSSNFSAEVGCLGRDFFLGGGGVFPGSHWANNLYFVPV